jgi:hypothetical protein
MSKPLRSLRFQGKTSASLDAITGDTGEIFWDRTTNCLRLYSGLANGKGGNKLVTEDTVADLLRIKPGTPLSNSTGTVGELRYDANYLYICTATNTWRRTAWETY